MNNYIIITESEAWALVDALGVVIDDMDHEHSADLHERVIPLLQGVQEKLYKAFNIEPVEGEGPFSHERGSAGDQPGQTAAGIDCPDDCGDYGTDICKDCAAGSDQQDAEKDGDNDGR